MKGISSDRSGLVKAIGRFFPGRLFSRWKLAKNVKWTPQRLVWSAVLMVWSAEQTLGDRFEAVSELLRELFPKWRLGKSYQGWCQAQLHWIAAVRPALAKRLQQQMQQFAGPYWRREGWCAFAADGSRVECPRTDNNKDHLGCAGKEKTGPQLFLTTLWHTGTGLPWDYRIGPGTDSERRHLEEMLPDMPASSLLIADAGFTGYDLLRRIIEARLWFLVRVGSNVHLLQELGYAEQQGDSTVYLWPLNRRNESPLVLRLIKLTRGKKTMYLLTNVLDKESLSDEKAAVFYEMRWGVEVFYRSTKQTLNRSRMLSRTPQTCEAELHWVVMGIWLLGAMTVSGIIAGGGDPLSWSTALARKRVRAAMRRPKRDRRRRVDLLVQLSGAVKDNYQRKGSKKAHDWPHKKREKPPGEPNIRLAEPTEVRKAKRLQYKVAA